MASTLALAALGATLLARARADMTPTAPGPGETFAAGSNCTIQWDADESGAWTNVTIDLMSGANTNMSRVATVAAGLDGTDAALSPFNWTCPEVDPYSAVYFYQFTNNGETADARWTTRFTIASPDGETVAPPNATQPDGEAVPWGTGTLVSDDDDSGDDDDDGDAADGGDDDGEDDGADGDGGADDAGDADDTDDADEGTDNDADDPGAQAIAAGEEVIAHSEQISPLDMTTFRKRKTDDADDGGSDDGADKKHGGAEHGADDGEDGSDEKTGDADDSDAKGSHTSASSKGAKSTKTASDGGAKTASGTAASHKATTTPKTQGDSADAGDDADTAPAPSSTKKPAVHSTASAAPKGTSGVADSADSSSSSGSVPTPALPPSTKKPHTSTSSDDSAPTAAKTTHASSPANTCSCSPSEQGGLAKLMDGGAGAMARSSWLQLSVPLAIALLVLC